MKQVEDETVTATVASTVDSLDELVRLQEEAVATLNARRAHVVSMIQTGKELAKETTDDERMPRSLHELIENLEAQWNVAYTKTVERLNVLKGETNCAFLPHARVKTHKNACVILQTHKNSGSRIENNGK